MTGAVTSPALTTKSLGISLAFTSPATSGGTAMWASTQAISQVLQPTHFSVSANMNEFNLSSFNVPASRIPSSASQSQPQAQKTAISVPIYKFRLWIARETSSLPAPASSPDQHGAVAVSTG
jgi:hypothetical protein